MRQLLGWAILAACAAFWIAGLYYADRTVDAPFYDDEPVDEDEAERRSW